MDRQLKRKPFFRRKYAATTVVAVAVVLVSMLALRGKGAHSVPAERVIVGTVTHGDFQELVPVTANVEPERSELNKKPIREFIMN